jgi:tetratricopeptide (TPR) repeat protein
MKLSLVELLISCQKSQEVISFTGFNYFYGKMGAGKSSIARIIDYCLGGELQLTPALQSEFVAATLTLIVGKHHLALVRHRNAGQIHAHWEDAGQSFDALVPARHADGEVIAGTGVEVLSDLFFYLSGMRPPKVRRSKIKDDSELGRLSLRDLLWYCYLDQDSIDNSFFYLEKGDDTFKQLKSRDVLRFIVGFHQERVSELEIELERLRSERIKLVAGAEALKSALQGSGIASAADIEIRIKEAGEKLQSLESAIHKVRQETQSSQGHATDELRNRGRNLSAEIEALEDAISAIHKVLEADRRHRNEILSLSVKFRRMVSARAKLADVEFESCPRCTRPLPSREDNKCRLCDQPENSLEASASSLETTEKDIKVRTSELTESIDQHEQQLTILERRKTELAQSKATIDAELNRLLQQYDSAYLSRALSLEHERARLESDVANLKKLRLIPQRVDQQLQAAEALALQEAGVRRDLKAARESAERDTVNLRKLESLFLDCLIRAKLPGFLPDDVVTIRSPWFMPEVTRAGEEEMISTSFSNLGSGGKKTLFKCCFALAIHRLAAQTSAHLPTLLIIDSPMKNISERENREQFEGFHELLYDLAANELSNTQFILIDKEFCKPPPNAKLALTVRHMTPDDPTDGPLISSYSGH